MSVWQTVRRHQPENKEEDEEKREEEEERREEAEKKKRRQERWGKVKEGLLSIFNRFTN